MNEFIKRPLAALTLKELSSLTKIDRNIFHKICELNDFYMHCHNLKHSDEFGEVKE